MEKIKQKAWVRNRGSNSAFDSSCQKVARRLQFASDRSGKDTANAAVQCLYSPALFVCTRRAITAPWRRLTWVGERASGLKAFLDFFGILSLHLRGLYERSSLRLRPTRRGSVALERARGCHCGRQRPTHRSELARQRRAAPAAHSGLCSSPRLGRLNRRAMAKTAPQARGAR
eukprot:356118-Chlamydomonas_euryale.AAC.9